MGQERAIVCILVLLVAGVAIGLLGDARQSVFPWKYSERTDLKTTSPRYSFTSQKSPIDQYTPCLHNCSWESFTSNSQFKAETNYTAAFSADDDQALYEKKKELACVPFSFGYSAVRGLEVFPPLSYPSCQSLLLSPQPTMDFRPDIGEFAMDCNETNSELLFAFHPDSLSKQAHLLYTDVRDKFLVQSYTGPLENVTSEYAFGACTQKKFTRARYEPVFNQSAYNRAREKTKLLSSFRQSRPISILFLTVDSFSRRHFYRKLPKTVAFLSELNRKGEYAAFDFKLHNVVGPASVENMVPMFSNQSLRRFANPPATDALGDSSLWAIMERRGFVTLLGFEDCDFYFVNYLGRELKVDHLIRTFYCGVEKLFDVVMAKNARTQRCVGEFMSHFYALNYTQSFSHLYKGANQFSYVHINTAHEASGQHAGTLDDDLRSFLQHYLSEAGTTSDVFLFLQGDHGMRYGDWERDIDAEQEHKLPALFFIAPTEVLDRIPYSYDVLWHNTQRLVSKRDLRATILALASLDFQEKYDVHSETYLETAKILYEEKVEDSRTCESIHIDPWMCSCLLAFQEIPSEVLHSWGIGAVEILLTRIVSDALSYINERYHTAVALPGARLCQKLTFDSVIRAYGAVISSKVEELEVVFSVKESTTAQIQVYSLVGTALDNPYFSKSSEWIPLEVTQYNGFPVYIRLVTISRKDAYAGPCESVSRANGIDAEFCLCRDLEEIRSLYPGIYYK